MKIAEIVGSYADSEQQIASNDSLFQTIANAFTRSGKVKRPLNQQLPDGQPIGPQIPRLKRHPTRTRPPVPFSNPASTYPDALDTGQLAQQQLPTSRAFSAFQMSERRDRSCHRAISSPAPRR